MKPAVKNANEAIHRFFANSKVPRSSEKFLQAYVGEISRPDDWEEYLKRWQESESERSAGNESDGDPPEEDEGERISRSESSSPSPSTACLLMKKRYVNQGIYYSNKNGKTNDKDSAFPLPLHAGLRAIDSPRNFVIPFDIYCPQGGLTRVVNWRPLKKSAYTYMMKG